MQWLALGMTALSAIQGYNQAAGAASYSRAYTEWQNKNNARRARLQGQALDTNTVRARTETAAALQAVTNSANEAASQARVAQAAAGLGKGSADTLLNSFARKQNQAEGNIMQQLIAELVNTNQQRKEIGMAATMNQAVDSSQKPSILGAAVGAAQNYFQMTYGLKDAFSLGGSSSSSSPGLSTGGGSAGYDVFSNIDFLSTGK